MAASATWGVADFLGGLKSRSLDLLTVLVFSQGTGLVLVAVIVLVRSAPAPDATHAAYAALAGLSGVIGLAAFYRGLAIGAMTVVAPISAAAAAIPVVVGLASGERPGALQAAGIVLAITGVVLAAREQPPEGGGPRVATGAGLALLSAVGFGGFFVAMDAASAQDVFWASLFNRVASLTLLGTAVLVLRPRLAVGRNDIAAVVTVGLLDISANTLFAFATTEGLVSVVAVLASLYPVVTILLARFVLHEQVRALQRLGVVGVLLGVALISAG